MFWRLAFCHSQGAARRRSIGRHLTASDQLEGLFEQALGRVLVPRLSTGTLQLSMRCSSVHFGPSLSLPVRAGRRACVEVALVAARSRDPSWAIAQATKPTVNNELAIPRHNNLMQASSNVAFRHRVGMHRSSKSGTRAATRNLETSDRFQSLA
jgi:hypothetical protein